MGYSLTEALLQRPDIKEVVMLDKGSDRNADGEILSTSFVYFGKEFRCVILDGIIYVAEV